MIFDGTEDMDMDNHSAINTTGGIEERTLAAVIRAGSDVTSTQVIYEQ